MARPKMAVVVLIYLFQFGLPVNLRPFYKDIGTGLLKIPEKPSWRIAMHALRIVEIADQK